MPHDHDPELARLNLNTMIAATRWTHAEVAARAHYTRATVSHHSSGRAPLTAAGVARYAAAFGVAVDRFYDEPPFLVISLGELLTGIAGLDVDLELERAS